MTRQYHVRGVSTARLRSTLALVPLILLLYSQMLPVQSIFNCFSQHMFKAGKGGHYQQQAYVGGPDRAHWYPQHYQYQYQLPQQPYANGYNYQQHSLKSMFQPKWKGPSLFGSKRWNNWKTGQNFYRPGYGYGYGQGYGQAIQQPIAPYYNEHSNVGTLVPQTAYPVSGDGWTVSTVPGYSTPISPIHQTKLSTYDSYDPQPIKQPASPLNPYSVKGLNNKYTGTKSVLVADGGYNSFDAHYPGLLRNLSYGYSYPEWYSGQVESPARIAQQLLKYGSRSQHQNRSAPLILDKQISSSSQQSFTMLDEPRFVGFGKVDALNNKEARLSCSFNEAIDQTNPPLWVKFTGPYNSSQEVNGKVLPPFNCASSSCRTQEIEATKDYRYKFDNGPATSTLIISEPRLADYGVYRCSALTKNFNENPIETVYQIIRFGDLF